MTRTASLDALIEKELDQIYDRTQRETKLRQAKEKASRKVVDAFFRSTPRAKGWEQEILKQTQINEVLLYYNQDGTPKTPRPNLSSKAKLQRAWAIVRRTYNLTDNRRSRRARQSR